MKRIVFIVSILILTGCNAKDRIAGKVAKALGTKNTGAVLTPEVKDGPVTCTKVKTDPSQVTVLALQPGSYTCSGAKTFDLNLYQCSEGFDRMGIEFSYPAIQASDFDDSINYNGVGILTLPQDGGQFNGSLVIDAVVNETSQSTLGDGKISLAVKDGSLEGQMSAPRMDFNNGEPVWKSLDWTRGENKEVTSPLGFSCAPSN